MLVLDVVFGSPLITDLLGIIAGHLYYFLTVLHPLATGKNLLKTPKWVYPLLGFFVWKPMQFGLLFSIWCWMWNHHETHLLSHIPQTAHTHNYINLSLFSSNPSPPYEGIIAVMDFGYTHIQYVIPNQFPAHLSTALPKSFLSFMHYLVLLYYYKLLSCS